MIVGASGQLGRTLSQHARSRGHIIIACDRRKLDVSDISQIEKIVEQEEPGCIVNCAAYTAVDKAESEVELAFIVNRDGAKNLAFVCSRNNIPLIHLSTDYVFDGLSEIPCSETDSVNPQNVYGRSKWEGEEAIRQAFGKHIILRISWVFGCYGHNFVKTIRRLAGEREELNVVTDQFGCPSSTQNISFVILRIIDQLFEDSFDHYGTYHYCDGPDTTWFGFANAIVSELRKYEQLKLKQIHPISSAEYQTAAKRPKNSRMDCSLIEANFGIKQYSWEDQLTILIRNMASK